MTPDQIRTRIEQLMQKSPLSGLSDDLRLMIKSQLQSLLTSADLVTREEFEVQAESLRRTQSKLLELEEKLTQLEQAD
ncbi:MAG: hypothetical protein CMI08_10005 [Oceanospirillaceae bacterium]|uniref:accessory factor UbiK family protein n=1 Tax=unclassified Thalassolituus TaxID=2624967 RepID=UPI000C0A7C47|nr:MULTISPECIES: accessory factor UbiK family protein [unclassified Thalassolituus]MAK89638.1 hypothetical protein [Thalassolituus sp.]MAS25409.1 hypothetical protein [Oceanospirillaceae bacterium]MAX99518.1 hypothetical protein [Oceanospirillaceae bacterium]MBL35076.1 hypothetical protein [Oceanospirillaceae bacterium]MBS54885.1 hypothetical protein [Oceanospirillaceae bacterium]|tara:strand:- start:351 stop:584 length:234 start_codon:yes stop_codon:yes gene_type:complete